ncbi:MAG TPA: J domain-containing protein [Euzebyales bacterium]|nr:J domain-containing protein [Euzebyales bacterium]
MADDPYRVLGVEQGTDIAQIRRAYLAQLRANHPDVRPGDAAAEERTRELNSAWEQVRTRHERTSSGPRPPPPRTRPTAAAYSHHQRDFRTAFTTATLRVALIVLALGLVLVAFAR